ncbi:MAG: hypothetical protein WA040_08540 [Anaerolineae bacterium]
MDEVLVFKSDKATYTARAGDDFLGGGQTAAVYRASTGDGQVFALKWLTDAVYEQRFFQEVDWLTELAHAPEEYGLKCNGQLLTPRVYDEQRQGERRFFVMDLALDKPLDEVLRRRGRLPEPAALAIAAQLARVFTALHEILRRSYLDFQPRNVFWQEQSGQIMVIDWNLLSPKDRMDVAADLRSIGALLYRMVLGALPPTGGADARGRVAAHEAWQKISLGARVLLQDLLEPRPGQRIEDARTARDRLDALCQRWEKPGDDLVREAAALFKQLRNGETATTVQDAILLDVAVCLDLAGRQTGALALSNAMAMVRHNLEQEVAGRRQGLTALARAISFFRSGDLDTASLLFEQALADAETPEDELQIRRWQAVLEARHRHSAGFDGAGRQRIEALLDRFQEATRAYLDRSLSPQPDLVAWGAVKAEAEALHRDIAEIESLAGEASAWPVILALQAGDWFEVPGETHNKKINSANQAKDAIAKLPYADNLWTVLGVGDERASVTAVEGAISMLEDAVQAERSWRQLWLDARNARWHKIDDVRIRRLFEEGEGALSNTEPIFDLLGVVIDKGQDALALALFEGLATSAGLTENDRRRVQAFELWLHRMQRLERFVNVWGTQVSAEPNGQASAAGAAPSSASYANGVEYSTTVNFPVSWVLSELRDLSQEEPVAKHAHLRLATSVTKAVHDCLRERIGLSQAVLLVDHLADAQWMVKHSKELDKLRDELRSIELDKELNATKQRISEEEERLNALLIAVSETERLQKEADEKIEEHRIKRMQEVEDDINNTRKSYGDELADLRRQKEEQADSLKRLKAETGQQLEELQFQRTQLQNEIVILRKEKGALESPPVTIARFEETVKAKQHEIDKLKKEIEEPERLGRVAEGRLKEKDDTIRNLAHEVQQLQLKNQHLEARLGQQRVVASSDPATSAVDGWRQLYLGHLKAETRILSEVRFALDEWEAVETAANKSSDEGLRSAVQMQLKKWRSWYERNNHKWQQGHSHITFSEFEQAVKVFEDLQREGVAAATESQSISERLATAYEGWVYQLAESMSSKNDKQKVDAFTLIRTYAMRCQRLSTETTDPIVRKKADYTRMILDTWQPHIAPLLQKSKSQQ